LGSVRELEARNASERKNLMQVIFQYLKRSDVNTKLIQEPSRDLLGIAIMEPAIQLKDHSIDSIRLVRAGGSGCGDTGEALRFQYKLHLEKEIPEELVSKLKARTKTIKVGKVLGIFGGKITGVKWNGQELADILNQDQAISAVLLQCSQIWGEMEFEIEAVSLSEVYISGPWFVNTKTILALYSSGKSYEEQNCVFGYKTIERVAKLIHEKILNINLEKPEEVNVTYQSQASYD
jgi:hypothetical protein